MAPVAYSQVKRDEGPGHNINNYFQSKALPLLKTDLLTPSSPVSNMANRTGYRSLPKGHFTTWCVIGTMPRMLSQFQTSPSDGTLGFTPASSGAGAPGLQAAWTASTRLSTHSTCRPHACTSAWYSPADTSTQTRSRKATSWASSPRCLGSDHSDLYIRVLTGWQRLPVRRKWRERMKLPSNKQVHCRALVGPGRKLAGCTEFCRGDVSFSGTVYHCGVLVTSWYS